MPSPSYLSMKRRAEIAETLLDLLQEHVELADIWERHYSRVISKRFSKEQEEKNYRHTIRTLTVPLLMRCRKAGFDYAYVSDIIPSAFETTERERHFMFSDLYDWAWDEFNLDELSPF